jgi:hypothetical protein
MPTATLTVATATPPESAASGPPRNVTIGWRLAGGIRANIGEEVGYRFAR